MRAIKRHDEAESNSSFLLFRLLQGFSYGLTDPADAVLVGMGVHPQRGAAVRMPQPRGDADYIGTVGDGKTGGRVAQLVRVEVLYPIPFAKSLEVTSWSVWVHRLRAVVLCESQQAADADQQFDLHYGAAQDEYLISCIYLARIHALTAKAGRYGGGTWTKWYESKGLSEGSARTMVKNGDAFNSATVAELKQLPELTRKDLNLIARSGCAGQLVETAGDSQRVQELLAQLKAEKERADAAEAERDKARADQLSTAKDCNRLGLKAEQEKARADKAEGERDEWKAEAEAARKQPIVGIVDKDEVARQVDTLTADAKAQARSQVEDAQRRANEAEAKYQKLQQDADGFLAPEQACEQQARFIADSMRSMYLNWFGQACATGTPLAQMGAPLYALCGEIMSSLEDDTTINPTAAGSVEDAEREALFE